MAEIRYYVSSGLRPHLYLWVADPRQVAFLCLPKEKRPKERAPRSRRRLPALLGKIGARLTRRALNNAPRAQTRGSLLPIFPAMLGGGYGVLKAPPREGRRWFAPIPVGASRAPSEAGSRRETFDRARGAYCAPGELGERPAEARRAGDRAMLARRSDRGSFSLVTLIRAIRGADPKGELKFVQFCSRQNCLLDKQRQIRRDRIWTDEVCPKGEDQGWSESKSPRVQGRSHPPLAFQTVRGAHTTFAARINSHG